MVSYIAKPLVDGESVEDEHNVAITLTASAIPVSLLLLTAI